MLNFQGFFYGSVHAIEDSQPLGDQKNVVHNVRDDSLDRVGLTLRDELVDVLQEPSLGVGIVWARNQGDHLIHVELPSAAEVSPVHLGS